MQVAGLGLEIHPEVSITVGPCTQHSDPQTDIPGVKLMRLLDREHRKLMTRETRGY